MSLFPLKPTHAPVKSYCAALAQFQLDGHTTGGDTRSACADLFKRCCSPNGWHLVEEFPFEWTAKQSLRDGGALVDNLTIRNGIWEAQDSRDDLRKEIKSKIVASYRLAVLHLLAIASELNIPLTMDHFDKISERTPFICDLQPGGHCVAKDYQQAGHVAPEAQLGGPIAAVHESDTITFDIPARTLTLNVPGEEIATRLSTFKAPSSRYNRGVFHKYANSLSSASQGAITT